MLFGREITDACFLEQICCDPLLQTLQEGFSSARQVVLISKVTTLVHPLVKSDSGLVHHILALPDTGKRKIPEIAVYDVLETDANDVHFLCGLEVSLQPGQTYVSETCQKTRQLSELSTKY